MSLPIPPNISQGQIALDPVNGVVYYRDDQDNLVATTWSWLRQDTSEVITDDNVTITGDLTVSGTTVSVNVESVVIDDNILILNNNVTGAPSENAGIEIERGTSTNVQIRWNESIDKWQFTNDGTTFYDLSSIIENSVTLGYHTVGDYVSSVNAGTGVMITGSSGEGSTPLISIGQDVSVSATPNFARVVAPLTGDVTGNVTGNLTGNVTGDLTGNITGDVSGNLTGDVTGDVTGDLTGNVTGDVTGNLTGDVTGNVTGDLTGNVTGDVTGDLTGNVTGQVSDISNHGISDLSDVTINDAANGDFLRYNGSNWINDPVNLSTDTVGDYVSTVVSGLGISVTGSGGEGSTPNVALNAILDNLNDVAITAATPGQILQFDGTNWVNTVSPTMEPIGFENKADSTLSFNEATRELTIAPVSSSFTVWCVGKKFVKTTSEKVQIANDSTLHFIFFDSEGRLGTRESYFNWESEAPVAYVYWNSSDQKAYFFADERHGIVLDWATHEYLHRTRGAAIANGFGASNYTTSGNGSSDADAQIDIANGTFFDEDLQVDITHSATPTANTWEQVLQGGAEIPVFYRSGSVWVKDEATKFPLKQGTNRPTYNLNTNGVWSTPDIDNSQCTISWIIATNNLNEPIIAILGQDSYTDTQAAHAEFYENLNLDGFPIVEFRPLYKLIFEGRTAWTNTPSARLNDITDLRSIISGGFGIPTVPVSDHGNLTGLSDDDHTQYLTDARHNALDHTTALGTASIDDLSDVSIATPNSGEGLIWNGSAWTNQIIPLDLDGLSDVVINSATPNQVLKFDGTNWVNAAAPNSSIEGTTFLTTIGNGSSNTFTLNHGLSTRDLVVVFTEANAPYASFLTTWEATDVNNITVYFEHPPANNSVRVLIYAAVSGTTANVSSINDIGDVTITSATPNQILSWNGSNWVNSNPSSISYAETIGDNSNLTYVITHDLGTRDIILQARNVNSPYESYNVAWEATTINTATVYFDSAPATNSVRIKIVA